MGANHALLGILLTAGTIAFFGAKYSASRKERSLPWRGWMGLVIVLAAETLLALRVAIVATFFAAIVWTGYLLLVDGLVLSLKSRSRLSTSPRQFLALAFWSVPLWLVFEGYNLRLANWDYVGMPPSLLAQSLGGIWAYSTIWPAIFETADFVRALGFFHRPGAPHAPIATRTRVIWFAAGGVMLGLPLVVPRALAQYGFGLVWLGFIPLLDTVNYAWGGRSLLREWEAGRKGLAQSLLVSGAVCGILWEFWNYWAGARWVYVFPILQRWKIFEMPIPGFLGFPFFALECFTMYEFVRTTHVRWFAPEGEAAALRTSESRN